MCFVGAVKKKIWWGGCEADTLDLSERPYSPSGRLLGAVWFSSLPTPLKAVYTPYSGFLDRFPFLISFFFYR